MRMETQVLAEAYRDRLYAAAFQVCKNPADAEDAAQEALLRYHVSTKEFESEDHIRFWLLRVAIYMDTLEFPTGESRELFAAVMALPEKYRLVIHLHYYEDESVAQIARLLNLTESNVKVRLSRGRGMLREKLKEEWDNDEP